MPIYMHIDSVVGTVTERPYNGWLELESYAWGGDEPGYPPGGQVAGTAMGGGRKLNIKCMYFRKKDDASSPLLHSFTVMGRSLGTVTIVSGKLDPGFTLQLKVILKNTGLANFTFEKNDDPNFSTWINGEFCFSAMTTMLLSNVQLEHEPRFSKPAVQRQPRY